MRLQTGTIVVQWIRRLTKLQPRMYNRYSSSFSNREPYYRYPSYGYYDDNYVNYGNTTWNSYNYGNARRYPYYWDRDDYSRFRRTARRARRDERERAITERERERREEPEKPHSPVITEVNLHPTDVHAVVVHWKPGFDGNKPILSYSIQYKEVETAADPGTVDAGWKTTDIVIGADDRSTTVSGLRPARRYHFRVYAENAIGKGDPSEPKPVPPIEMPQLEPEELAKVLKVTDIDIKAKGNAVKHHTSKYRCVGKGQPVVRRGDTMEVTITFDREYDMEKSDAKLEFSIGQDPSPPKGTQVEMNLIETKKKNFKPDEWGASFVSKKDHDMTIQIHIPANCIVGPWNMVVKTFPEGKDEHDAEKQLVFKLGYEQDIFILFNPWCKDDGVHMVPEANLKEYILNDTGFVFSGTSSWPSPRSWAFAQFHEGILDAALYLLLAGFGGEPSKMMSDPIIVSRIIAKMINAQDDNGVLVGNWSGDYEGGTSPSKWIGSSPILQEFMEYKKPVKYAQCWVYSAVLTTVCRALGIPCRSVTNFDSSHDTDGSNTIDAFYGGDGEPMEHLNADSTWNFHVWNEGWMSRPDLDEKSMNGWQVIDGTPQETSYVAIAGGDNYACGPCPVAAVKRGLCNVMYDTSFVFSEVNADRIHWKLQPDDTFARIRTITDHSGTGIWTKDPKFEENGTRGMEITHEYKFVEGSVEERNAVLMAHKTARYKRDAYTSHIEKEDIKFHLKHENALMIGKELEVQLTVKHKGASDRTVQHTKIQISPKTYFGRRGKPFFKKEFEAFDMKPKEEKKLFVKLKINDYLSHLVEGSYLYIEATADVPRGGRGETQQRVFEGSDFKFEVPDLEVQGPDRGTLGEPVEFKVRFTNPLNIPLTKCDISVESSGFEDMKDIKQKDVPAGGKFERKFKLKTTPSYSRYHVVLFNFDSKECPDITGRTRVTITDDDEE